jgi:hypothetical protein
MEGFEPMQPDRQPDDIHSIMSRFTSWAGKQAGSGLAGAGEGVREVPYEEAIERLRSRRRTPGAPAAIPTHAAAAVSAESAGSAAPAERAASLAAPVEAEKTDSETPPVSGRAKRSGRAAERGHAPAAQAGKGGSAAPSAASKRSSQAKTPEFRQVLAKSVAGRGGAVPGKAAKTRKLERDQRVSVRLSRDEERELQKRAAGAGITVSQYLRQCALAEQARTAKNSGMIAGDSPMGSSAPQGAAAEKPSGFGEWITLLRNRFLSSPARFAERA